MIRHMKKILFFLLLIISGLSVYAQVGSRYVEREGNFSICPPGAWTAQDLANSPYKVFLKNTTPNASLVFNTTIFNGSFEGFVEGIIRYTKTISPDAQTTSKEVFVANNGLSGYKFSTVFTRGNFQYCNVYYIFRQNNKSYFLSYNTLNESIGSLVSLFDESARTFEIIE